MKFYFLFSLFFSFFAFSQEKKLWALDECIQYAKNHNLEVLEFLLKEDLASINVKAAKMNFLPNLGFQSDYSYNSGLSTDPFTGTNIEQAISYNRSFINSSIILFDGLKNFHHLAKSKIEKQLSRSQTQEAKLKLEAKVIEHFIAILYAKGKFKISKEQMDISKNMYIQIQKKFKIGIIPKRDLISSEAELALNEKNLINAENQLELSKIKLALLLRVKGFKNFEVFEEEFFVNYQELLKLNPEELEQKVFLFRPEIKSNELKCQITAKKFSIEKASLLPTLRFNYQFSFLWDPALLNNGIQIKGQNRTNSFTLSLNWPIFDKYFTKAKVQRVSIEQKLQKLDLEKTKNELRSVIYQIYIDTKNAYWSYQAAIKAENFSKLSFEYAKKSYDTGVINAYEFNNTKKQWLDSQLKCIKYKYEYLLKFKIIELYIGKFNF